MLTREGGSRKMTWWQGGRGLDTPQKWWRYLWTAPYMSLEHLALAWGLAKQRKRKNFLHRQDQLHLIHGKPVGSILFSHCLPKPSIPHNSSVASQCIHFTWLQQQHWKPKNLIKQCPSSFPKYSTPYQKQEFDVKSLHRIYTRSTGWSSAQFWRLIKKSMTESREKGIF